MKLSRIFSVVLGFLFMLLASSASAIVTQQVRAVNPFSKIKVESNVAVYFVQDEAYKVVVEADEAVVADIVVKEENGSLIIRNSKKHSVTVHIYAPELADVTVTGASSFTVDSLQNTTPLNLMLSNSAKGNIMRMRSNSNCKINVSKSSNLTIELESTANTEIAASEQSTVKFTGECAEINANSSAKSTITLLGKCNSVNAAVSGTSFIEMRELKYDYITKQVADLYSGIY